MLADKESLAHGASFHDDDDASASDCSTSVGVVREPTKRETDDVQIGNAENNLVFWLRMIVLAVLVLSTVSVELVVFFYTSDAEEDEFEK
jgi:predicted membrane-bound mannosyltransferase